MVAGSTRAPDRSTVPPPWPTFRGARPPRGSTRAVQVRRRGPPQGREARGRHAGGDNDGQGGDICASSLRRSGADGDPDDKVNSARCARGCPPVIAATGPWHVRERRSAPSVHLRGASRPQQGAEFGYAELGTRPGEVRVDSLSGIRWECCSYIASLNRRTARRTAEASYAPHGERKVDPRNPPQWPYSTPLHCEIPQASPFLLAPRSVATPWALHGDTTHRADCAWSLTSRKDMSCNFAPWRRCSRPAC